MKIPVTLIMSLLLSLLLKTVSATDIVIRNADSVRKDTLQYSTELSNVTASVLPRIVVEYSNSIYGAFLSNVPIALANLTGQIPSTRRLIVNYAASTYRLDLLYSQLPVAIEEKAEADNLPKEFRLFQNYPNPFNPTTTIRFDLPKRTFVTLKVYDVLGREVATLVSADLQPGEHKVDFNAFSLASGLYLYRLETKEFVQMKKLMLLR